MLSHRKLDLSYFFFHGGAENCVDLLHISVAEIAEENNLPQVLEKSTRKEGIFDRRAMVDQAWRASDTSEKLNILVYLTLKRSSVLS